MEHHHAIDGTTHNFDGAIFNSELLHYQRVTMMNYELLDKVHSHILSIPQKKTYSNCWSLIVVPFRPLSA